MQAVKPIALSKVSSIAQMIQRDFKGQGRSLSGIGGVERGGDAAEFLLLGADTVQVGRSLVVVAKVGRTRWNQMLLVVAGGSAGGEESAAGSRNWQAQVKSDAAGGQS